MIHILLGLLSRPYPVVCVLELHIPALKHGLESVESFHIITILIGYFRVHLRDILTVAVMEVIVRKDVHGDRTKSSIYLHHSFGRCNKACYRRVQLLRLLQQLLKAFELPVELIF